MAHCNTQRTSNRSDTVWLLENTLQSFQPLIHSRVLQAQLCPQGIDRNPSIKEYLHISKWNFSSMRFDFEKSLYRLHFSVFINTLSVILLEYGIPLELPDTDAKIEHVDIADINLMYVLLLRAFRLYKKSIESHGKTLLSNISFDQMVFELTQFIQVKDQRNMLAKCTHCQALYLKRKEHRNGCAFCTWELIPARYGFNTATESRISKIVDAVRWLLAWVNTWAEYTKRSWAYSEEHNLPEIPRTRSGVAHLVWFPAHVIGSPDEAIRYLWVE